ANRASVPLKFEDLGACSGVPNPGRQVRLGGDHPRAVRAERRRIDCSRVPSESEWVGVAETMNIMPLPTSEVDTAALKQGPGGRNVIVPPLLVGYLDCPPVIKSLEHLTQPLGF